MIVSIVQLNYIVLAFVCILGPEKLARESYKHYQSNLYMKVQVSRILKVNSAEVSVAPSNASLFTFALYSTTSLSLAGRSQWSASNVIGIRT